MALAAGSVSVDPTTGAVSGGGAALALYQAEAAGSTLPGILLDDLAAFFAALPGAPFTAEQIASSTAHIIGVRQRSATKCQAQAEAIVTIVQLGTVVVPSTPGTYPVT